MIISENIKEKENEKVKIFCQEGNGENVNFEEIEELARFLVAVKMAPELVVSDYKIGDKTIFEKSIYVFPDEVLDAIAYGVAFLIKKENENVYMSTGVAPGTLGYTVDKFSDGNELTEGVSKY